MAAGELDGCTLGQKRKHYNKLVENAIRNNKKINVEDFKLEDSDIINLMNIDIASHNKNVEYILKVFTCDDMLYVSRAIKQSDWLINDKTYAHIINPKYFNTSLFPFMCSKAIIKLVKHVRTTLKDEKRAEEFYSCEKKPEDAAKWLPYCSLKFIEENVKNHIPNIKSTLLKRLCEKSITVLEIYVKNEPSYAGKRKALQNNMFLLPFNIDKFLDLVEENEFPDFNKKATIVLMKNSSNRVINKFDKYNRFVHLPTFVRCLKQGQIKEFLINQAKMAKERKICNLFNPKRLLLFIQMMPQEIRFDFVKQVFIDKIYESKDAYVLSEYEREGMAILCNMISGHHQFKSYFWYQFAPFNIAFQKIQDSIASVTSSREKISMLEIALLTSLNKLPNERAFLEYLRDKHKNTDYKVKVEILKKIILQNNFITYDIDTWTVLDDIFRQIDIYVESKDSENIIIEAIILYTIIHNEKVSEIVENKFSFNSLLRYHKKLCEKQKEMIFTYLYDVITIKLAKCIVTNESEFKNKMNSMELVLNLLKDYRKNLGSYPIIISIIKDLIKTKYALSLNVSMEKLFNVNKTWRKLLFEESLELSQTKSALLNALKHNPSLLKENERIVQNMLYNDKLELSLVLSKIKIYWPDSLAKNIIIKYTEKLNDLGDHKATTRGLSILLSRKHLQTLVEKYIPTNAKINWGEINEIELSVQQQFAKNMHCARPQPFPKVLLQFAKGDYLQYALPSLLSIFYNLNSVSSQTYILDLLDTPVSLQKHAIRLAVSKIELEKLLVELSKIWKNNKNASIRSVMFKLIFKTLCKEKDLNKTKKIWEMMEMFIENLTFREDKSIYMLLLYKVKKVPLEVRARFYMKSYIFLHKLIHFSDQFKHFENEFYTSYTSYSRELIEELNPPFVVEIITEYNDKEFTKKETNVWSGGEVISIISSYLVCTSDYETQLERYENVLLPILKKTFTLWNTDHFIRKNLKTLLESLRSDIKQYVIEKKKVIPSKIFSLIQEELQEALEITESYILLTTWKLTTTFVNILHEHHPILDWKYTCMTVASKFGKKCCDYLKEDCNNHFPRIYLLFVKVLETILTDLLPEVALYNVYRELICDNSFIPGYLAAIKLVSKQEIDLKNDEENKVKTIMLEIRNNICDHPSNEVRMHYNVFKRKITSNLGKSEIS